MTEKKVRGRRAEKKAKKVEEDFYIDEHAQDVEVEEQQETPDVKTPFFGLVESTELDYFKQAEKTLNIDAFDSPEDREAFIRSVLEEAKGKELKLVTNQICSKLMERLVLFASDVQLKRIFTTFAGHWVSLAHHKYASHVLETLLVRSAALIEKELKGEYESYNELEEEEDEETANVTFEGLFIKMLNEYKTHIKSMIKHQYASHVLRLVILVVSGKELPSSTMSNSVLRSKKSKIARKMIEIKDNDDFNKSFQVPPSFKRELRDICQGVRGADVDEMRALAIDKVASPVIQLLLSVEGIVDKERAIWNSIFLNKEADAKEEAFVEFLLSDPVGSHFFEALIKNEGIRLRYIERLYNLYIKDRVLKLVKRATTGVYIIQALLFRLKPADSEHIMDVVVPELSQLMDVENENLDLCSKLIDALKNRFNYQKDEIIRQIFAKFDPEFQYEQVFKLKFINYDPSTALFENVLQLSKSTLGNTRDDWPTAEERKRSLFLEKLMEYDQAFIIDVWLNLLSLPEERVIQMCMHGVFSHVVEQSMVVGENERKSFTIIRKRLLNIFEEHIVNLSCNSYGSHIVDKLWEFTIYLPQYKDKVATALAGSAGKVKELNYGKMVWKNWSMDLFIRKKYDWKALVKEQEVTDGEPAPKTKIQLKMEQLAEEKKRKLEQENENDQKEVKRQRGRR